jgi:hypothetical protein
MKPDKYEKMAEKWLMSQDGMLEDQDSLSKLLRRVYRMGQKDGYWLGHNGHPISTNKKRGER